MNNLEAARAKCEDVLRKAFDFNHSAPPISTHEEVRDVPMRAGEKQLSVYWEHEFGQMYVASECFQDQTG